MNLDLILFLVFVVLVFLFYLRHKSRFEVQGKVFALYKTTWGLKWMDKIAKRYPRFLRFLTTTGIFVGFLGMIVMTILIVRFTLDLLLIPGAPPALAPVLPGIEIVPGIPRLSFLHWIISIIIIAIIHEFSHGVAARLYNIKIKSSGFAFLGPIPAAFVEPDEKQMEKKSIKEQLGILAAGSFSNILLGGILAVVLFSFIGVGTVQLSPTQESPLLTDLGAKPGDIILEINDVPVDDGEDILIMYRETLPGDEVTFLTSSGEYKAIAEEHPQNPSKSFFNLTLVVGIFNYQQKAQYLYGEDFPEIISWFVNLLVWLFVITIGVGLFNLLPLGPVDGGKMLFVGLTKFMSKEKSMKLWKVVSIFLLLILIINLLPWFIRLFNFLIGLIGL